MLLRAARPIAVGVVLVDCAAAPGRVAAPELECEARHDLAAWREAVAAERGAAGAALIAVDVAAGWDSTCAIDQVGEVWCWGGFDGAASGEPRRVDLGAAARAIAGSETGYCAVLIDGSTACFGPEFEETVRSNFPRPATAVALSGATQLVRLDDGSYHCADRQGRCERGGSEPSHELADGQLACVSERGIRPAPNGDCAGSSPPWHARLVRLGPALRNCGDDRRWRDGCDERVHERVATDLDMCERLVDGTVRCAGDYAHRRVRAGDERPPFFEPLVPVPLGEPASKLVAGSAHACALGTSGQVRCWGSNRAGQVGAGPSGAGVAPARVVGLPAVTRLAGGGSTFCALDRAGALWCWGAAPALGRDSVSECVPEVATPVRLAEFGAVQRLAVGDETACVLEPGGAVRCVGWFERPLARLRPTDLRDRWIGRGRVEDISLDEELCILRGEGRLTCGRSRHACGRDCNQHTYVSSEVREIDGRCARTSDNEVYCWSGWHNDRVAAFAEPIDLLRAVEKEWCVRDSGGVACGDWRQVQQRVEGLRAVDLAVGRYRRCAVDREARVRCWSRPDWGHDAAETGVEVVTPGPVEGIAGAVEVAVGDRAVCARLVDGSVQCWGGEAYGELGRGYLAYALAPMVVVHGGGRPR